MARVSLPEGVEFYTVAEVAAHLRVSKMTVYRSCGEGNMPSRRIGRAIRIPVEQFREWQLGGYRL